MGWVTLSKGRATAHHQLTITIKAYGPAWPDVMFKEKVEIQIIKIVNQLIFKCWQLLQSEETTTQT